MSESEVKRIGEYVDECRRLGEERFAQKYPHAILLRREDDAGEEPDANFHTAFMRRDFLVESDRPGSGPPQTPLSISPAGSDLRPSDRPKPHPVGEVLAIAKRQGAPFQDRIGVGRARNADICVLLPKVSKYHAFFTRKEDGAYTLTDAGSKNGTFIDGRQLAEKVAVPVEDGNEVLFGPYRFTFYTPEGFLSIVGRRASLR
jgi:hypothetical protein